MDSTAENESIKSYSQRICNKIKSDKPILIGLSFGGIIATEISKIISTEKIILIASAKTKFELPILYRIIGMLKINKLIPTSLLRNHNSITNWLFGVKTPEHKKLLGQILKDTDPTFLKWAINEITNWENVEKPKNYFHIHGDKDRIIPIKNVETNFIVENGGHFMTVNKSKEIEKIIKRALK